MSKTVDMILNAEVGDPDDGIRKLKIIDISVDTITFDDDRTADKVFLTCQTKDGEHEFKISEAWSKTRKGNKVQGLWVQFDKENKLVANSTLAKLLNHLNVSKLNDLIGKDVIGYPDTKGYVVLTTYPMDEDEKTEPLFD
jgi:hypothetical protein